MFRNLLVGVFCFASAAAIGSAVVQGQETVRTTPVTVGEMAPDFSLESHAGEKISLAAARGKSPVVLVFYRGYW